MAYADLYNTADASGFQHMAYVAAWVIAQDIIGTPLQNTTQQRKDWAQKVMADSLTISPRQLAFQMLRNATVAAGGVSATDQQMLTACLERLDDLVQIG